MDGPLKKSYKALLLSYTTKNHAEYLRINYGSIEQSYSVAKIVGTGLFVGGLVGDNEGGDINRLYFSGNVSSGGNRVGGLVGRHRQGTISSSYVYGFVQGNETVGGLVGSNELDGIIVNCYSTGSVLGTQTVGALAGFNFNNGIINNSFTTGTFYGCSTDCGGLIGLNSSSETPLNNFSIVPDAEANGTIIVESEMFSPTHTFYTTTSNGTSWDLVNTWEVNGDYPNLR